LALALGYPSRVGVVIVVQAIDYAGKRQILAAKSSEQFHSCGFLMHCPVNLFRMSNVQPVERRFPEAAKWSDG
jgi:hypothetical protein